MAPSFLKYILAAGGGLFLLIFLGTALSRLGYPYELEWMEGGAVDHVRRVIAGQPLYIRPSLVFTPFIYTPLYYYVSALLFRFMGVSLFGLRLISFLSSVGCLIVLYQFVRRETKEAVMGVLTASLFAATYVIGGTWFDLARTDMLSLFLLLAGIYILRFSDGMIPMIWAGVLVSLSFFTKQTALMVAIPLMLYCLLLKKRICRYIFPGTIIVLIGGVSLIWNYFSDGWFAYYIFDLPGQHIVHWDMLPSILVDDMGQYLPVATFVSLYFILLQLLKRRYADFLFFGLLFGGLFGAACFSRMHSGGYINVLIPGFAVLSIYFGLGIHAFLGQLRSKGMTSHPGLLRGIAASVLLLLCIWQFWHLRYEPRDFIPTGEDIKAGDNFIHLMGEIEGEVFIPYHGYLSTMAGKETFSQGMAMEDVFRGNNEEIRDAYKAEIRHAIQEKRFGAIILDDDWRFKYEIGENYKLAWTIEPGDSMHTFTGMITRPKMVYLPRE